MMKYILDATGQPVPEPDLMRWAKWFETSDRHVGDDTVNAWRISTVFLSHDHSFGGGPPVLWETMVFGPEPWGDWQERYTSREDAENGHRLLVEKIKNGEVPAPE